MKRWSGCIATTEICASQPDHRNLAAVRTQSHAFIPAADDVDLCTFVMAGLSPGHLIQYGERGAVRVAGTMVNRST